MTVWRFLLLLALAFGSVMPHCATAAPVTQGAPHHMGMAHNQHQPSKMHVSDACIGCATPVRLTLPERITMLAPVPLYQTVRTALTTHTTALDPPPPRMTS